LEIAAMSIDLSSKTPKPVPPSKASLDRMADLTRRIVAVKKSELPKVKKKP
jgi:hypothetical protein